MTELILGLLIFLGVHSVRIVADEWRGRTIARVGGGLWKGLYSLLSLAGLALIAWGFDSAREQPVLLWTPWPVLRHVAIALTLVAFVLLAAAYMPSNGIKARVHHPMVLGVKVWALSHLLVNGYLSHVLLFGAFLAWSALCFSASRRRDRRLGLVYTAGNGRATALTCVLGVAAWALFAYGLHGLLIGIKPMG